MSSPANDDPPPSAALDSLVPLLQALPEAGMLVDARGRIVAWNDEASRLFGYTPDEIVGRPVEVLLPEARRTDHERYQDEFARTGSRRPMAARQDLVAVRKNGATVPVRIGLSPIVTPHGRHVLAIVSDMTYLDNATHALRSERERLRTIAETVPGAVHTFVMKDDGTPCFPYASPRIREIYGVDPADVVDDCRIATDRIHPEDREHVWWTVREAARRMSPWRDEYRVIHPERGEIWVEGHSMPVREPDGSVLWHGILVDVTARRKVEAAQAQAQKLEALGTLAGGIAHDFNNILLAISGNAETGLEALPEGSPVGHHLEQIAGASRRAADLVRRILAFSRPHEVSHAAVPLEPAVSEALRFVRATLPANVEIHARFAPDTPSVAVEPTEVHQIVVNLATNSAHAIGSRPGRIWFEVSGADLPGGRHARLTVRDDGCGMDAATLTRIFDPFFTTKAPGQGTGLGLSVVHGIVTGHGGALRAESEPGHGARFELDFPAAAGVPDTAAAPRPDRRDGGGGKRILFVDDEESIVQLVSASLLRRGFRVEAFTSPEAALDAFVARPGEFDAVVTDLSMPHLSGVELARRILAIRPEIPVVMASGYATPVERHAAVQAGVRELIAKPYSPADLARLLQDLPQDSNDSSG